MVAKSPPVNTTLPIVTGTAQVGQLLNASDGGWNYVTLDPNVYPWPLTYQWEDCASGGTNCVAISGATQNSYVLTQSDLTHAVRVTVVATNDVGATTVHSDATAAVQNPPAPVNSAPPVISGPTNVGDVLTVSDGGWDRSTGPEQDHSRTFAYQWQQCDANGANCLPISGATHNWYRLVAGDQGNTVRAVVSATNPTGTVSVPSDPAGAIQPAVTVIPSSGLHVSGNQLLNDTGATVHLHGVNRSGTEYACIQDWGIFDGPSDAASVSAIAAWHANIVRVPINEDCWLGINGVDPAYSGQAYRDAIVNYVDLLHQYGMYAELSLIWAAPGAYQATYQSGSPDEDHSPALWASLANTFRNDHNVILAPWGETVVDANCFLNGGVCEAGYAYMMGYDTAGMQQAVDVMRQAGYTGVIAIPGVDYANDLSQWLQHEPVDPRQQLMAEAHVYGGQTCSSVDCFNSQYAPVAAQVPVIFGETGETYDDSSCGSANISTFMNWADSNGVGYEAWTWDTWGSCGSLIADYSGTPANQFGSWVQAHYLTFPAPNLGP